jgi:hypothetical protein
MGGPVSAEQLGRQGSGSACGAAGKNALEAASRAIDLRLEVPKIRHPM